MKLGFTLIELLVVLVILSLSFFILTPKLTKSLEKKEDPLVLQLDKILSKAKTEAKDSKEPVEVTLILSSSHVLFNDKRAQLPGGAVLLEADVDEHPSYSLKVPLKVYPEGVCDYFILRFSDGRKIVSMPLLCKVKIER